IAIAGNHDNGERLSFASNILKRDRLYIKGSINPGFEKIVLQDEFGPVNFYVIPYMDPPVVREVYGNDQIRTADDAVKAIMSSINEAINLNERNVAVTHGFIIGIDEPKTSESERTLNVGRAEYVSYE